jgi:tetraacyldisaccharide 4'-kinase
VLKLLKTKQQPVFWLDKTQISHFKFAFLRLLGVIYSFAANLRFRIIRQTKVSVKVICVGNCVVGGGGKTPCVILLAELLRQYGKNPYIISRGYKSHLRGNTLVESHHTAYQVGDEPILLAKIAPCIIGKNRRIGAKMAIEQGADVIIMDDGLQNNSLHKDFSILMIDGGYGFGNGEVLPAGPLREPLAKVFAKLQMTILVGKDSAGVINKLPKNLPLLRANMQLQTEITPQSVVAFCGIARPCKFYDSLRDAGFKLLETHDFPDHHQFSESELRSLQQTALKYDAMIVTTQKDWVRLQANWQDKITFIPANLQISNVGLLVEMLQKYDILPK